MPNCFMWLVFAQPKNLNMTPIEIIDLMDPDGRGVGSFGS